MAAETRAEKQNKRNQLIALGTGLGAGITQYKIDKHLSKVPLTTGKRVLRAGVIGTGLTGLGILVNHKLHSRAKQYERELIDEKGQLKKMANNTYFDSTGLQEFIKTAAAVMGKEAYTVPTKYAYNAYLVYNELPEENKESATVGLYNQMCPGMDKVAMKLVAANVYADVYPEKTAGILGAMKSVGGSMMPVADKAMSVMSINSDAHEKLDRANNKIQYKVPNSGFH